MGSARQALDRRARTHRAANAALLRDGLEAVLPRLGRSAGDADRHGAVLDGELVGVRCAEGAGSGNRARVAAQPGDEALDADGALLVRRSSTATTPRGR